MSDSEDGIDMFKEPEGFYEPEKEPTFEQHRMLDGQLLTLRLVGSNPLWVGHTLFLYPDLLSCILLESYTIFESRLAFSRFLSLPR